MWHVLTQPWPWYVGGPLIGLSVPALLLLGNKPLGTTGSLRAICAAIAPGNVDFFRYDWKGTGLWNIALALGVFAGAFIAVTWLGSSTPAIATTTQTALATLGLKPAAGLVPAELFNWHALLTLRGAICMLGGGFLVGFGATYGGGCTSGHGIMGLAALQRASLVALMGIFAGGLFATYVLLPLVL